MANYSSKTKEIMSAAVERILAKIKESDGGKLPWQRGFKVVGVGPRSYATGELYRGGNWALLYAVQMLYGYSGYWISFERAKRDFETVDTDGNKVYGGVRKGEKGWPVIFPVNVSYQAEDKRGNKQFNADGSPTMTSYTTYRAHMMFSLSQCERPVYPEIEDAELPYAAEGDAAIDAIIKALSDLTIIEEYGRTPAYSPATDVVYMPAKAQYNSTEEYYSDLFHEVTHWTGERLGRFSRENWKNEGREDYGYEELVAETASMIALAKLGINKPEIEAGNAAYVQNWMAALENNPEWLWLAAIDAAKAVDWIFNGGQFPEYDTTESA